MGLYFQEVFGRYLWNCPSTLKIEENKMNFFSILGLIKSSPNSLGPPGTLWDPLHRVPEEELKSEFNRKVALNNGLSNFPVELRL